MSENAAMITDHSLLIHLAIAVPLLGAVLIGLAGKRPNLREAITLLTAALLLIVVLTIFYQFQNGETVTSSGLALLPGFGLSFTLEPLGMTFALVASSLWILNSIYSIGYMRGNQEKNQTRFYVCFAIALAATMTVAMADNLFTLFIGYEVLTLSTYPLVTHKGDDAARQSGRTYLGLLMSTSIGLLLLAILLTWHQTGSLTFTPGGLLAGKVSDGMAGLLLVLYMFGIGKAALMPIHRWLPAAMVAPTPVSALLHAVAVVKAGVFSVLKVAVYIFGIDHIATVPMSDLLLYLAAFTVLASSIVAMRQDNLKKRLAYSTVSQLSYVIVGALLGSKLAAVGGAMHIPMHAFGKITLFFCAGAIYTAAHKTEITQLNGLGRTMPFTMAAFFLGALSVIGLPPMGGSWSKFLLALGAVQAEHILLLAVLMISSLLNVVYLLGPVVRAFFYPPPADEPAGHEAPLACVLPLSITALGCVLLFFAAPAIYDMLLPLTIEALP